MKIACYAAGSVGTNNYVVSDDNGITAIIDCDGNPAPLYSYIEKNNLKVTHILLTHGHYDHTGSVNEVAEHYGCTIVGCAKEMRVFTDPSINCSHFCCGDIIVHPDVLVNNGDVVKVGDMEFEVLETPGHTEGSICYICKDTIFSGDTLFQGSCGRTDLPTGNWNDIIQSLKKLAALPGDYQVYSGHGPATTLETERRTNPYMK
ncbi:MAG: MBL fold metallo-hydrolase [Bacteroidales bacterium]|nr:MBL fold metallo-hydrolase [Anaerotignum sp.]MCI5679009.1 MBL fold metallo-hydrolase [Bacteroidales bacterium]MDY3927560.1 MBL fold metallo-hydrolase [Anaerotignum sp.]